MSDTWLVVGLGNPGPDYSHTRHNIGFMVADELAGRLQVNFRVHKSRALVAEGRLGPGGPKLVLVKPQTYMNLSGGPVAALAKFFDIPAERVIAVHDELDIPFDTIKLKLGGGEGGHNGLRHIAKALGTKDFYRVRVGIGRPPGRSDAAGYVLKPFSAAERKDLPFLVQAGADAVQLLIEAGLVAAQQKFHAPAE
ncbi:aminoacyl-tRNA hydrolase [Acaricomes phytoseiuli]|uniref:aminoacyl-tRNA hydrolase n=1 Tax=Acaricomes phytoseiuli TaxID=291968 RepID=UPI000363175F|nr:aminoacyl-tRNA hydrolase [Acaricomes phytoseiuli]MCW1249274.1 aminoacyl-tRNA hydrolase [Acaricomes phytoseiuli]